MKILVTGGAGYIGSHTTLALLQAGHEVVVIDNLCNGSSVSMQRVKEITGKPIQFVQGDIRDENLLDQVFSGRDIDAVMHFAGLKSVGESLIKPLHYYDNNFFGTLQLCRSMEKAGLFTLVFSSSATVYGHPIQTPVNEQHPVGQLTNPYGRSKLMIEDMLRDLSNANQRWRVALLRYFNPVGAHDSGLIGEDPHGIPNNLLPYISQVAIGKLSELTVFGQDYDTADGTGVRDYIHVQDLAEGHLKALKAIQSKSGLDVWNLGTGRGYSVLEALDAFQKISGKVIPYRFAPRRQGDVGTCYAAVQKAQQELGWQAKRSLNEMLTDAWRWQQKNPDGYR